MKRTIIFGLASVFLGSCKIEVSLEKREAQSA